MNFLSGAKMFVERKAWLNQRHLDCFLLTAAGMFLLLIDIFILKYLIEFTDTLGLFIAFSYIIIYGLFISAGVFALYNIFKVLINSRNLGFVNTLLSIIASMIVGAPGALIVLVVSLMTVHI